MIGFFLILLCSFLTIWPLKPNSSLLLSFTCLSFPLTSFLCYILFSLFVACCFLSNPNPLPKKKKRKKAWTVALLCTILYHLIVCSSQSSCCCILLHRRLFFAHLHCELLRAGPKHFVMIYDCELHLVVIMKSMYKGDVIYTYLSLHVQVLSGLIWI